MKYLGLAVSLLVAGSLSAQSSHSVNLSWTASPDGGTVNVYRAAGSCAANPTTFASIQSGVPAAGPFVDEAIAVGQYCYRITAVVSGAESAPSNTANAAVLPKSPSVLTVTVN